MERAASDALALRALDDGRGSFSCGGRALVGSDSSCLRFRAPFVRLDFLFESVLEFVRRLLELGNAPSKRPAQFWQLARAEDDECNDENDDELRHTEGTEHDALLKWT